MPRDNFMGYINPDDKNTSFRLLAHGDTVELWRHGNQVARMSRAEFFHLGKLFTSEETLALLAEKQLEGR